MPKTYAEKLQDRLTRDDWQYIASACQVRFTAARPKKGEPDKSKEFAEQEARIMDFLLVKAYKP